MFKITIATDNTAFHDDDCDCRADDEVCLQAQSAEIARILIAVAKKVRDNQECPRKVLDINGNTVGEVDWQ